MQLLSVFIAAEWSVTFVSAASRTEYMVDLEAMGVETYEVQLNSSTFDVFIKDLQPTAVMFDRFMTEEQYGWRVAEHCPSAIRILDSEDLHFLRKARQQAVLAGKAASDADLYTDEAKRELASILRCDLTLIISSYEMQLLTKEFNINTEILLYLPFFSNKITETEVHTWKDYNDRSGFMFIGNFHHRPNHDAVIHLKKSIWPLIRTSLPKAEIRIYGAYMPAAITQLHSPKDGFLIVGRAENAADVLGDARVLLAPLRFGAGLKGKLMEAMAAGTPSVTTTIGAEGMDLNGQWNGTIADDPRQFADGAVRLLSDEHFWSQCVRTGILLHKSAFTSNEYSQNLIERTQSIRKNIALHRQRNFIGSILLQQSLNATKFMSKWIEAKNNMA